MESINRINWYTVLLYVLLIAAGFAAALGLLRISGLIQFGSDAPAWVQAVGSVAVIFAAALVARWQQKLSQIDQEAAEQRQKIARHVRANRVIGRFLERIDEGIKQSKRVADTGFSVRIKKRSVPKELREFEGELHLIPGAGGPAMTAMDAFRRARKLLINKHVTSDRYHEYIREMSLARTNCAQAVAALFAALKTLKE